MKTYIITTLCIFAFVALVDLIGALNEHWRSHSPHVRMWSAIFNAALVAWGAYLTWSAWQ